MQNDAGTCGQLWHKIDTICSADVHSRHSEDPPEKEKPGALAGATGLNSKSANYEDDTTQWLDDASRIGAAIDACNPKNRLPLVEMAFEYLCAGAPGFATDQDAMTWARCWAGIASRAERKAYALACFEALAEPDRQAFLAHVGRAAA